VTTSAVSDGSEGLTGVEPSPALVPDHMAAHTSCLTLKIGQVVFRIMEDKLAEMGLRIRHYSVLGTLLEPGPMSQQDLGTFLRIDAATIVSTIDQLEAMGLVARTRGLRDRRRYVVSITPAGESMLERIDRFVDEFDVTYLADVTATQRRQLHRMLTKLSQGGTLTRAFDDVRNG
jgi:DNA-binding MarR family transcriptional regulator